MPGRPLTSVVAFGKFELDPVARRLRRDGQPLTLGARAFDVLCTLVAFRDEVVSREALLDAVWPGRVVEENNLSVQIGTLRRILGVDAIATIPGRGYRFAVPIDRPLDRETATAPATAPAAADPGRLAPARSRGGFPARAWPLVGRDDDLGRLVAALTDADATGGARLVTLVGAGGVGKTRLAVEALVLREAAHVHGGCLVDLAPLPPGVPVAGTVASALGLELGHGAPEALLAEAMAPLDVVLLLDNAEHLLDPVARLCTELLERAPRVRVLVTSQTPLRVAGERVIRLDPLAVPEAGAALAQAAASGAVRLFVQRACAADRRFELTEENVGAVVEVCRRIDGLPLALELAAARVPVLGVRGLAAALEHRFEVLTTGTRDAPARQQTLRAALEWSLSLLDEREAQVFRCLGVVASSAPLHMIQALTGWDDSERWLGIEALAGLVDRSLVQVTQHDPPRYRMLDTPRSLARSLLAREGAWDEVSGRHARALRRLFEDACRRIVVEGRHQASEMVPMELARDDARVALDWAVHRDRPTAVSLMIGVGLVRSAQGAFTLEAPLELLSDSLSMPELDALPAEMLAWWAFNYSDYARSDARLPPLGRMWAERALDVARRQGVAPAVHVAQAALLAHLPVDGAESADVAARLDAAARTPLPFVRTTALAASALRHWRRGEDMHAVAALESMIDVMDGQGLAAVSRVARTSLIAFWAGADRPDRALAIGRPLLGELEGTRNERALADCRRLVGAALLFAGKYAEARALVTLGWSATGVRDERMHPGWIDVLALLAAGEGRCRTAALLLERADRAWGERRRGRTSVRMRERVAALLPDRADGRIAGAPTLPMSDAAIEALALALEDA